MWIEEQRAKSVVRLGIAQTNKRQGSATGFIVVNTAKRLVVLTCGHSFKEWAQGTEISVQFHDKTDGRAEAVWVNTKRGVALLLVDTSSIPDLSEYPAVDFSYDDVRIGDVLVTLGYPHGRVGNPDIWNNLGSVT